MNIENFDFELDPSYDPERIEGGADNEARNKKYINKTAIRYLLIPDYEFDNNSNPYAYDSTDKKAIKPMAARIEEALKEFISYKNTLIRAVRSQSHSLSRDALISSILENGSDVFKDTNERIELFADAYSNTTILFILDGFHKWKPKCDERPQYPLDIWMVYDKSAFDNVAYVNERHNVIAKDKWRMKDSKNNGLKAVLVIN